MTEVTEGYFSELNVIVNKFIELIKKDTELCKLIYYNDSDPLSQPDFKHSDLLFTKIFPLPKNPDATLEQGTIVDIYFYDAMAWKNNSGYKQEIIYIDILCHLNTWKYKDGLRPYIISNKIDSIFNNKFISDISMNKVYFERWTGIKYSDFWYGFRFAYKLTNTSNVR
jgi:hypothetical protein